MTLVHPAIAIGIRENRDSIRTTRTVRWGFGNTVITCARIAIDLDSLETFRVGVLQILNHPQTASVIVFDADWLAYKRLGSDDLNLESIRNRHSSDSLVGAQSLCIDHRSRGQQPAADHCRNEDFWHRSITLESEGLL